MLTECVTELSMNNQTTGDNNILSSMRTPYRTGIKLLLQWIALFVTGLPTGTMGSGEDAVVDAHGD